MMFIINEVLKISFVLENPTTTAWTAAFKIHLFAEILYCVTTLTSDSRWHCTEKRTGNNEKNAPTR